MIGFVLILIITVIAGKLYVDKTAKATLKENFAETHDTDLWRRNPQIAEILNRLRFVRAYNEAVFHELKSTVREILTMYYLYIGGNDKIKIDDFQLLKVRLSNAFEEISMNIPYKYHKRTRRSFMDLNYRLNEKMKLIKLKSSKIPIKISLMNSNLFGF